MRGRYLLGVYGNGAASVKLPTPGPADDVILEH